MPDWQKLVWRHLLDLPVDAAEKNEIHAELAAHLEDNYESWLRGGIDNSEAARRTLCLASDWQDLRQKISFVRREKDTMTNRVVQLWLPGLATFVLSAGILAAIEISGAALPCLDFGGASRESDLRQSCRPQHCSRVSDFCSV